MKKILKSYIKKLTNLANNNKSLHLLKLSKNDLDIHDLDYFYQNPSYHIIEQIIAGNVRIFLADVIDSRNSRINDVSKILKNIHRREKLILEERGARDLFIGWPFVEGKFLDGTLVRGPLIFFPVTLELDKNRWILISRKDSEATINKSFLIAYAHYNQIKLDEELLDTAFDLGEKNSTQFRTQLYELFKNYAFEINFNQDLFVDKLVSFDNLSRAEAEVKFKNGEIKFQSKAVLGLFPQSGSMLIPDYEFLIQDNTYPGIQDYFIKTKPDNSISHLSSIKEEQLITPFAIDASQENAIREIKTGKSIVVQGPPGTGKSQLICNVLCDFVARGKKVLVVCQKRAALDVVYERLKEKKIENFIGIVHDYKNDRTHIFKQIGAQINDIGTYKLRNNNLNTIHLERDFVQVSREIDLIVNDLTDFKTHLFETSTYGVSIKELYLTTDNLCPFIDLQNESIHFNAGNLLNFTVRLESYFSYKNKLEQSNSAWLQRNDFKELSISDRKRIEMMVHELPAAWSDLNKLLPSFAPLLKNIDDCFKVFDIIKKNEAAFNFLLDKTIFDHFLIHVSSSFDEEKLNQVKETLLHYMDDSELSSAYFIDDLEGGINALQKAYNSSLSFFSKIKWKYFASERSMVADILNKNNLSFLPQHFKKLLKIFEKKMQMNSLIHDLKNQGWQVEATWGIKKIIQWIAIQEKVLEVKKVHIDHSDVFNALGVPHLPYEHYLISLKNTKSVLKDFNEKATGWRKYLHNEQEMMLLLDKENKNVLSADLIEHFDFMVEMDGLFFTFNDIEKGIVEKIHHNKIELKDIKNVFQQNIQRQWISAIEEKHPVLRSVNTFRMREIETRLQDLLAKKEKLSNEILLIRLSENTYKNISYNRLYHPVTYRDLYHQVNKKKKIWPIRKIIEHHHEEVLHLVPAWLLSPEAATAVFPMETFFDLVIFDEASQCFAEYGIPSVFRGKQILITGDSQQLQPNDLYTARFEEEEEDPDLEMESLLDLGMKYLPQTFLIEHYRSKSLELIDFSNKNFYDSRLSFFPERNYLNRKLSPISYVKVNGSWNENRNMEEAEEVVGLVVKLHQEDSSKSLGVVTFNYKQSQLIQDHLEVYFSSIHKSWPSRLFVKNIENVQGDECDIVIFSLGYAPNMYGKMVMQFGSLNQSGGANRLNVAITRAREKIYLITSLFPEQLIVEDLKNEGPKLLKKYLEYAFQVSNQFVIPSASKEIFPSSWYLSKKIPDFFANTPLKPTHDFDHVDLEIKIKEEYSGCVVTDDEKYYQRSVKDFHAYFPLLLRTKQWPYKYVYSRQYYVNKENLKDELFASFNGSI